VLREFDGHRVKHIRDNVIYCVAPIARHPVHRRHRQQITRGYFFLIEIGAHVFGMWQE